MKESGFGHGGGPRAPPAGRGATLWGRPPARCEPRPLMLIGERPLWRFRGRPEVLNRKSSTGSLSPVGERTRKRSEMGCDGGTIPKRHELVKGPRKAVKVGGCRVKALGISAGGCRAGFVRLGAELGPAAFGRQGRFVLRHLGIGFGARSGRGAPFLYLERY